MVLIASTSIIYKLFKSRLYSSQYYVLHCRSFKSLIMPIRIHNELKYQKNFAYYQLSSIPYFSNNKISIRSNSSISDLINKKDILNLDDFIALKTEELTKIPEHLLTANDIGLTYYMPTNAIFKLLTTFHNFLPWWTSIILLTISIRLIMFPLMILSQNKVHEIMQNTSMLSQVIKSIKEAENSNDIVSEKNALNDLEKVMSEQQKIIGKFFFIPLINGIVFSSFFFALKDMSLYPIPSMKSGGLSWWSDLSSSDPYFIFPIVTSATLYYILNKNLEPTITSRNTEILKYLKYILPPCVMIGGATLPVSICVYWTTNNIITICQTYILKRPFVMKRFNIKDASAINTLSESDTKEISQELRKCILKLNEMKRVEYFTQAQRYKEKIKNQKL